MLVVGGLNPIPVAEEAGIFIESSVNILPVFAATHLP
jgi:repressor of nif and glnA expression